MTIADAIRAEITSSYWRDCVATTRPAKVAVDVVTAVMGVCAKAEIAARFELEQPAPVPAWVDDVRRAVAEGLGINPNEEA